MQLNLQRQNDYVVMFTVQSIDAFSAYEQANQYMQAILSLHRIYQHDSKLFVTSKAIISKKVDNIFDSGSVMHSSINAIGKKREIYLIYTLFLVT